MGSQIIPFALVMDNAFKTHAFAIEDGRVLGTCIHFKVMIAISI